MTIILFENQFTLLPENAIFWHEKETLMIADLHLGKATHFQKQGIQLPANGIKKDYENLNELIDKNKPKRILILGDLFHSTINSEWLYLENFIAQHNSIEWLLIQGNHDIINKNNFAKINIKIVDFLEEENFNFSHFPLEKIDKNKINFAGHLHPGYTLNGKGKQSISLPCFYMYKNNFILPAFGTLTGFGIVNKKNAKIYIIAKQKVIEIT